MPPIHVRRADLTIPGHWRKRSLLAILPPRYLITCFRSQIKF